MHLHQLTHIAAAAIIAQIAAKSDTGENWDFCATVDGVERLFEARFSVDWKGPYSDFGRSGSYYEAHCTLTGAWEYDDEGDVSFAGNRAEVVALIGNAAVRDWEERQAEREDGI